MIQRAGKRLLSYLHNIVLHLERVHCRKALVTYMPPGVEKWTAGEEATRTSSLLDCTSNIRTSNHFIIIHSWLLAHIPVYLHPPRSKVSRTLGDPNDNQQSTPFATMSEEASADERPITFTIKTSGDAKFNITVSVNSTVASLKDKLSTAEYANLPPERQRLIYSGRVLKDADTLAVYKIKDAHTVHLVKGAESNARQNPAAASAQGTSTSGRVPPAAVPNMATGTGANNLLAGLTGARYAGLAQLPDAGMFGPDGGVRPYSVNS